MEVNVEKTQIEKTKEILFTIYNYCEKNDLIFLVQTTGYFYRFYVGFKEDLVDFEKDKWSFSSILLTREYLFKTDFNLFLRQGNLNCSISPTQKLREQKKNFNELFVEVFWGCEKASVSKFFEHWDYGCNNIDFNYIIPYANERFPGGFFDKNVVWYDKGLNWHHFIDLISGEAIVDFFEDFEKLRDFHKLMLLQGGVNDGGAHSFLRKMVMVLSDIACEKELSQNAEKEVSCMLMDVFKEKKDFQEIYANKKGSNGKLLFPFMKFLIEQKRKDDLFVQDELFVIKVLLPINDIYSYFTIDERVLLAENYEKLTNEIIFYIGSNNKLKELGLEKIDISRRDRDFVCYLNLNDNKKITKEYFIELYKELMNILVAEKMDQLVDKKEFVDKMDLIVNRVISNKTLGEELNKKADTNIKKIKI